jgi:hypothetical protein
MKVEYLPWEEPPTMVTLSAVERRVLGAELSKAFGFDPDPNPRLHQVDFPFLYKLATTL